jgi:CRP/FNR family transcriptional regulator, dissimilatory nitrate respiration regulator
MLTVLNDSPLFKGLDTGEIKALVQNTLHQFKQFANKEVIAFSGEPVEKAMILLEGRLQGEMLDFSGNRLKIEEIEPPQMVAAAFLYGPQSVFPVNLSALSDGRLLVIFKKDFTLMLSKEPRVLNNYLNIVSAKAQFLSKKITFLSYKTIKEKIAFFLLQRLKSDSTFIQINLSQTEVAGLMGVARPSLARTISDMQSEGIINWERNRVKVLNADRLNSILGR